MKILTILLVSINIYAYHIKEENLKMEVKISNNEVKIVELKNKNENYEIKIRKNEHEIYKFNKENKKMRKMIIENNKVYLHNIESAKKRKRESAIYEKYKIIEKK